MNTEVVNTNLIETHVRWSKFNWAILILIFCVAFTVIGIVSLGFYRSSQLYQKYFPLTDASMEMRIDATMAYLWFEEMLGGNDDKNMDDILDRLDQADWYANAMIDGGENDHLKLLPIRNMQIQDRISNLQILLKRQRVLIEQRINAISTSGPGSEIDKAYHSELENFFKHANNLEMDIKHTMAQEYRRFKILIWSIIACCVSLFSIIGFGFYRYESIRRKDYLKIRQMESMLMQNEKMKALGTMISGIAHEVNNPNGVISFNLPILKDYIEKLIPIVDDYAEKKSELILFNMPYNKFRQDLHGLIRNITNGSNRINLIVSDLKAFSRKKDKIKKEWVEIEDIIQKVVNICGFKISSLIDSFETDIPEEIQLAHCDPEIVELILINFLTNAAEAADKKDSWIKLSVFSGKKNPNSVTVEVRDNGCGINKSDMDKIFEPFFSTKSTQKGAGGLGLYLCNAFANQMGAVIEVDSVVGKESSFRLIMNGNEQTIK